MASKLPDNFQVTDNVREWSLKKYRYYNLPDFFISAFKTNWQDRIDDKRPPKWKSPELALKRWVRESSPSGSMYNATVWESAINQRKEQMKREVIKVPLPEIKRPPKPVDRNKALNELKKMKLRLGI